MAATDLGNPFFQLDPALSRRPTAPRPSAPEFTPTSNPILDRIQSEGVEQPLNFGENLLNRVLLGIPEATGLLGGGVTRGDAAKGLATLFGDLMQDSNGNPQAALKQLIQHPAFMEFAMTADPKNMMQSMAQLQAMMTDQSNLVQQGPGQEMLDISSGQPQVVHRTGSKEEQHASAIADMTNLTVEEQGELLQSLLTASNGNLTQKERFGQKMMAQGKWTEAQYDDFMALVLAKVKDEHGQEQSFAFNPATGEMTRLRDPEAATRQQYGDFLDETFGEGKGDIAAMAAAGAEPKVADFVYGLLRQTAEPSSGGEEALQIRRGRQQLRSMRDSAFYFLDAASTVFSIPKLVIQDWKQRVDYTGWTDEPAGAIASAIEFTEWLESLGAPAKAIANNPNAPQKERDKANEQYRVIKTALQTFPPMEHLLAAEQALLENRDVAPAGSTLRNVWENIVGEAPGMAENIQTGFTKGATRGGMEYKHSQIWGSEVPVFDDNSTEGAPPERLRAWAKKNKIPPGTRIMVRPYRGGSPVAEFPATVPSY